MKILSKLAIDTVCKSLIVFKVYLEEILKFYPSDRGFFYKAMFMLMPFLGHYTMQKQGSTRDVVGPIGSSGFEVVLILLTKAIPVQMRITIIEVRKPGFQ